MKKLLLTLIAMFALVATHITGQTYVNEMTKEQVQADCYIEGGGVVYNDEGPAQYEDLSYVQKTSADTPTAFIFNMDLCNDKYLTGLKVNMLLRLVDEPEDWIRIEYSLDELTYHLIPDMHIDFTYNEVTGNGYWADVYYQAALPERTKEIKVTLLAKPDDANWIPCYRRTELFYETGTPYAYVTPPDLYISKEKETFSVNFEVEGDYIADTASSENTDSYAKVVENPKKDAVNNSDYVLELKQVPSDPEEWGWGNGDWFGVAIAVNDDSNEKQMTKIVESNKYLHFSIYRTNDTQIGMETWGGSAGLKEQYDFEAEDGWVNMMIDLGEYIGKTFDAFYFSPNTLFATNNVQEAEFCYIDNIVLSDDSNPNVGVDNMLENSDFKIITKQNCLIIKYAAGKSVSVYDISGTLVKNIALSSNSEEIQLNQGVYIIKVDNKTSKAIVF